MVNLDGPGETSAPLELRTFTIKTHCVLDDEALYKHISSALERNLPVIGQHYEHDGVSILVASGPSVSTQLEQIKEERLKGRPIVAIKDAHDWLIENGIIPDYAVAIDPKRWNCFKHKNQKTKYLIASQCPPEMFDHLRDCEVYLWHLYVRKGQSVPPHGTPLIAGGTTTGMRAITLLYTMGYRHFELYGYDSCLKDGVLRVNGDLPKEGVINEIVVDNKLFYCSPAMTAQANEFQKLFEVMPDLNIESHGEGLITTILEARKKQEPFSVSFIHAWPESASYRYRAKIPAEQLGASINDLSASVWVIAKPDCVTVDQVQGALDQNKKVIIDFCDDHFERKQYQVLLKMASEVTCSTQNMAERIQKLGRIAYVIPDPYFMPEQPPHCQGNKILWYGHASNRYSFERVFPSICYYPIRVVSNAPGDVTWKEQDMAGEFARADIVILPATASYKSPNRAIEAIRQGCFVVAEPHPSLMDFPGIYIGNIKEGIEWAIQNLEEANRRTLDAQSYVSRTFTPRIVACAWSQVISGSSYILEAENAIGMTG